VVEKKPGLPLPAVLGGAAAVLAVVVGGGWYFWPQPDPDPDDGGRPPAVERSVVRIDAAPWANVTLTPVGGGDPFTCTTPCQLDVPAGSYDLALENKTLSGPIAERLTVPAGQPVDVHRTMPGFDVDRAVASIVQ
jgi:hypothetical protein